VKKKERARACGDFKSLVLRRPPPWTHCCNCCSRINL